MSFFKRASGLINGWFDKIGSYEKGIFDHEADGFPCAQCGEPMISGQRITAVGNGEKMHQDCWGDYFSRKVGEISDRYQKGELR